MSGGSVQHDWGQSPRQAHHLSGELVKGVVLYSKYDVTEQTKDVNDEVS